MSSDRFNGQRLQFNDEITYKASHPAANNGPNVPVQDKAHGPYTAKIVDFTQYGVGVRADGFHGRMPLYYVYNSDIISVKKYEGKP